MEKYYTLPRLRIDERMKVNDDRELKREYFFIEAVYDQVLDYMVSEMNRNLQSDEFRQLQELSILSDGAPLLSRIMELFRTGGKWDHKPKLQRYTFPAITRSGDKKLFVTPIRGDNTYLYFYDIWSNIHYGFIMSKLEIWDSFSSAAAGIYGVFTAALKGAENNSKLYSHYIKGDISLGQYRLTKLKNLTAAWNQSLSEFEDEISISIGQKLANSTTTQVTTSELHRLIFSERQKYDEGQVKFRWDQLRVL